MILDEVPVRSRLDVFIPGLPRPQGSLKIITSRSIGRAFAKNSDTTIQHRNHVAFHLAESWGFEEPALPGPVRLDAEFWFPRPKSHYGTGKNADKLKASAPTLHTGRVDLDKLVRLLGDALTIAGVINDDCLIFFAVAGKQWVTTSTDRVGTQVTVSEAVT